MLIMLASLSGFSGGIPVTMLLVAALYLGQQIYDIIFVRDNVANFMHIVGGVLRHSVRLRQCGAAAKEKKINLSVSLRSTAPTSGRRGGISVMPCAPPCTVCSVL